MILELRVHYKFKSLRENTGSSHRIQKNTSSELAIRVQAKIMILKEYRFRLRSAFPQNTGRNTIHS